jgi:hypothetical protein
VSAYRRHLGAGLGFALALAFTGTAAADPGQGLASAPNTLVRGGAPLPEFHLNFLGEAPGGEALEPLGAEDNLEIALSSPNQGVLHFLFSPRPQFGFGYDPVTATNRGYAGLTWNLFDNDHLFGSVGLAGSYAADDGPFDPVRRPFGPSMLLHGALEFGYQLGPQHSLSLRLDDGRAPEMRLSTPENSDSLQLRYGMKF